MDKAIFNFVNHGMQNRIFDRLMPLISDFKWWIPIVIIIFAWLIRKNPKRGGLILLVTAVSVTASDFINHRVLKELFARIRPCHVLPDVHLLSGCSDSLSFPSSHAVNAFVLGAVIGLSEKKLLPFCIAASALVAFSRVYLGVHYPSDVIAGALIGAAIGFGAYKTAIARPENPEKDSEEAAS